ncbi:MAG TPA: VOC family protein, partial [Candidatus Solibacter sp.]|nr:VOC family protein [Candidatus Solibacter sp.]
MDGFLHNSEAPYLGVHAVAVFVRDQDAALQFYVEKLGFRIAFDRKLPSGRRWVTVAPPDGSAVLSLIEPNPESREQELIGRPTGIVFLTENVIKKWEQWRRRGVEFTFTPRLRRVRYESPPKLSSTSASAAAAAPATQEAPVWGGVFARFKDLDGNIYSLVGFDEANRQIEAQRRAAAEKIEAERRATHELEIARQVQARLFPQTLPPLATLEYAGACIQARKVGGDYH